MELLTCSQIAARIAAIRGQCQKTSVWRAIQRLKIQPAVSAQGINLYNADLVQTLSDSMRKANRKSEESK